MSKDVSKDEALMQAARNADAETMKREIEGGASVNARDRETGASALHYIAAQGAACLARPLASGKCDHLARDRQGRLASELAGVYGSDPAMARLLMRKELQQARAQGLELKRRGQEPARKKPRAVTRMTRDRDRERDRER
ncbi:MAG: hypothetical protein IPK78_00675 [Rhodospirillales bacterium]|nr:hypothetical protein [Rhodospirillales bacterium]